jgi:hypothetical protein
MINPIMVGIAAGLASALVSGLITGWLFHPYQKYTPATWRAVEGPKQYAAASALTFVAAVLVAILFELVGNYLPINGWLMRGCVFGLWCWAALAAPALLSVALFVNWHRGFVVGILLDWLLVALISASIAAYATRG